LLTKSPIDGDLARPFLQDRVEAYAIELQRDVRTARRRMKEALQLLAERLEVSLAAADVVPAGRSE
jgi:hypothetical protein